MKVGIIPSQLNGSIVAPQSKSYAHRLIICAYLSGERVKIENVGESRDVFATLNALKSLGLEYLIDNGDVTVWRGENNPKRVVVDCDESGSTMRFLLPIACALGKKCTFSGKQGLLNRPIESLVKTLNENGADITNLSVNGKLKSGTYLVDATISSQYISGLLFALSILDGDSRLEFIGKPVSTNYLDITLDALRLFNIDIQKLENGYFVKGNQRYNCNKKQLVTEGDYSGSAFILCAGAIGGRVEVKGLNKNSFQGDREILNVLKEFGATVTIEDNSVTVGKDRLNGITYDCENIPDLVQIISVVAAYSKGVTTLKNVQRLKIKESDRITAIIEMLSASGVRVEYNGRDLIIYGGQPSSSNFDGGNDHRTVMSQCVLALYAKGNSTIVGAQAIKKSYPNFFNDVSLLGGKIDVNI